MRVKAVSGIMLTLLLIGMLKLAFNVTSVVAQSSLLVDQSQTLYNVWAMIYNQGHAQSFVPSHNMLSRVDVLLQLSSGALDYIEFKIFRDDGTGFPDTSVVLATAELVPGPDVVWDGFEYTGWYIADFADIEVTVGQRYYIWVDITYGSPEWKGKWGVADGHGDPAYYDLYPNGEAWTFVYILPTPSKDIANDFTFKTYYPRIARTWTVDDDGPADFHTIQAAIDVALDGDTIHVASGTYNENVNVYKSVSVVGAGASVTIVNASNENDYVFFVTADNVNISGFTVTGTKATYTIGAPAGIFFYYSNYGSITNIIALNNPVGIHLYRSDYNTITTNTASNNEAYGIYISYSSNNTITSCTTNSNGLLGVYVDSSNFNAISNNTVNWNNNHGIYLEFSSNNTITNNTVNSNKNRGIVFFSTSNYNTITDNTITNNEYGIFLDGSSNLVYHNNFIYNTIQAYDDWASTNIWDDGYPSGGNYWSDHVCTGNPSDGSQPYIIDANNIDRYPFQDPNGWLLAPPVHVFEVVWGSEVFCVLVESNSTVSDFNFIQANKEISFNVIGLGGTTGFCNVTIPKALLIGEPWLILIDGMPIPLTVTENSTHAMLYFTYAHSTHKIQIMGTWVIGPPLLLVHMHSLQGLINLTMPEYTCWHELYPDYCEPWHLTSWEDTGEPIGELSLCDQIEMTNEDTEEIRRYHVEKTTITLLVTSRPEPIEEMYIEFVGPGISPEERELRTYWHEVHPNYSRVYYLSAVTEGGENFEGDLIGLTNLETSKETWWRVEHMATDLILNEKIMHVRSTIEIDPDVLNLRSMGEWITCYIELPEGYNVSDIDIYSIRLNDTFPVNLLPKPPVPVPTEIGDYDNDAIPDLMVKFNRTELTSHIYHTLGIKCDNVTLTVSGELSDGALFEGSDTIRVMFAGDICGMYDGAILPIPNGVVDLDDFMIIAMPGHIFTRNPTWNPTWGPTCDLNKDDKIGVADLMMVGINYGATVPPQPSN